MSHDFAIRLEGVGKQYKKGVRPKLRSTLARNFRNTFRRFTGAYIEQRDDNLFWALRDVTLEIPEGQIIGFIGRNGAGKSTLLKLVARITEPTEGRITTRGRVGALLEVGTGFHPDLTGRQNIALSASILGIQSRELKLVFDEIVDFSGVENFIDTPIKYYSSGMYVRLAFSVAVHLKPDILVLDEVLAVGDAAFQKKSLKKMEQVTKGGSTVLFVSHSMASVANLCDRCVMLDSGLVMMDSIPDKVIPHYLATVFGDADVNLISTEMPRTGSGIIRFTDFHLEDASGTEVRVIQSGQDIVFVFGFEVTAPHVRLRDVSVGFGLMTHQNVTLFAVYSEYKDVLFDELPPKGNFRCRVEHFPLTPGSFKVGARILLNGNESDWPQAGIGEVTIVEGDYYKSGSLGFPQGSFYVDGSWTVEPVTRDTLALS